MSVERVGKNFAYSLLVSVFNALYPIFAFPYTARVLGPQALGQVNFAGNLASYFVLASSFGLQLYGVREIAKVRRTGGPLEAVFGPLFGISFLASLLLSLGYLGMIFLDTKFAGARLLFAVFSLNILGNAFLVEWFFAGVEDFRYIAIRNAIVKLCTLPLLFQLVQGPDDAFVYSLLVVASTVVPAFWNFRRTRIYVARRFLLDGWRQHLQPMARFLAIAFVCSLATSLPTTYLGYMWSEKDVGLFTMAYRVVVISLMVVSSLGSVMLPYLSGVRAADEAQFDRIVNRVFIGLNLVAVPATLGIWLLSDRIALILGGTGFLSAGRLIGYLAVILLLSVNSSFFVQQVMYPRGEEDRVLRFAVTVSIVAALVDFLLIRHFGTVGAASGLILSESLILIFVGYHALKKGLVKVELRGLWKILAAAAVMGTLVHFTQARFPTGHQYTLLACLMGMLAYGGLLLALREETCNYIIRRLTRRDR